MKYVLIALAAETPENDLEGIAAEIGSFIDNAGTLVTLNREVAYPVVVVEAFKATPDAKGMVRLNGLAKATYTPPGDDESGETELMELVLPIDTALSRNDYPNTISEANRVITRSPLLRKYFSSPRMVGTGDLSPNGVEYYSLQIEFLSESRANRAQGYNAVELADAFVHLFNAIENTTNFIWTEIDDTYIAINGVHVMESGNFIRDLRGDK